MENLIRIGMFVLGGGIGAVIIFKYTNNIKKEVCILKKDMKDDFGKVFKEIKGLTSTVSNQMQHHLEKFHTTKK